MSIFPFKSFIFMDLESTGLPFCEPDGKRTRITEICMVSVTRKHLLKCAEDNYCPRVTRKVILPINPGKVISPEASDLSGLDNFLLEDEQYFNENIAAVLSSFLKTCSKPICLIAHNGFGFDFPLLREELKKFSEVIIPSNTACSDSVVAFRELDRRGELEKFEYYFSKPIIPIKSNLNLAEPFAISSERDRSPIRFSSEITDIDLVFNEVAKEIERIHSPRKENNQSKATDVIKSINETTPKSQPLSNFSPSYKSAGNKRRQLFTDQALDNRSLSNKKSFRLKDVYKRLFGEDFANQHEAESDVIAMIKCCAKYGEIVIQWFEKNHKYFGDIEPMYK